MANNSKCKVSPLKRSRQNYKWYNYLANGLVNLEKETENLKKEIKELKERVGLLEQRRKHSNNNNN